MDASLTTLNFQETTHGVEFIDEKTLNYKHKWLKPLSDDYRMCLFFDFYKN